MKVLKFGGTSVGSADSINGLLEILKQVYAKGEKPIVVLSAMSGVTNLLTQMAEDAAQGSSFTSALKELEVKHFAVIKKLIQIKNQNPVFTQLKIFLNELEDLLQGVYNLRELSAQSKD